MAGDQVCDGSNMSVSLQIDNPSRDSLWIPTSSIAFYGAKSMVNFENDGGGDTFDKPFFQASVKEENGDEDFDVCLNPPGKKRRLKASQVQFLERNFEVENKLEPERKIQLAKELGLQPRQVAIWFQNRRARFKNKQLEKDYDSLKTSYDRLKVDYDNLLKEKENLKMSEEGIENLEPIEAMNSPNVELQNPVPKTVPEVVSDASLRVTPKQEEASSAKSDVFDSDSPHSFLEPGDSSHILNQTNPISRKMKKMNLAGAFCPHHTSQNSTMIHLQIHVVMDSQWKTNLFGPGLRVHIIFHK
ncbi:hypothetical protein GH714_036256 [Hevea brasiliensis]|uniref:Homeobox-leucine zipper protein n=1 Tax=Hevea brasiliensis TaxID=3981 RepID=A0A6A6LS30_HEVBR|nr:hypothetical protein GH714_036256 [Hevea brasiliensis]